MEGRQLVQWDKDSCADAGFLKIDLLGLGMLSAVERCVEEIARARGERIDLSRIPHRRPGDLPGDPGGGHDRRLPDREPGADADAAAHAAARPSTTSPSRWRWCARGRSRAAPCIPTWSAASGCARTPRYRGSLRAPVAGADPRATRSGTIVFQEQVIQVAMALAGFSAGEAEGLRRAMSRKRSEEAILAYREQFIAGARERGVDARRWRSASSSRSAASRASGSRRPTRSPSACSPTSRPGCGSTTAPSSSARCSTSSRWASTRPTRWCTRRSGGGSRCCRRTSTAAASSARSRRRRAGRRPRPVAASGWAT